MPAAPDAFSLAEIEGDIEAPPREGHAPCLTCAERAVRDAGVRTSPSIPAHAWDVIADSVRRRDPSLSGWLDLRYGGAGPGPAACLGDNAGGRPRDAVWQAVPVGVDGSRLCRSRGDPGNCRSTLLAMRQATGFPGPLSRAQAADLPPDGARRVLSRFTDYSRIGRP